MAPPRDAVNEDESLNAAARRMAELFSLAVRPRASPGSVAAGSTVALGRLVRHAARKVPHWRDLFLRAGIDPAAVSGMEDLQGLPVTGKTELLEAGSDRILDAKADPRRLFAHHTSGSTGQPLVVYRSRFEEHLLHLFRMREDFAIGVRPHDRRVQLSYASKDRRPHEWPTALRRRLGLFPIEIVPCTLPLERIADSLRSLRPDVLQGYSNVVGALAHHLARSSREVHPRLVIVGGEMLRPSDAEAVRLAFDREPIQSYGATECNLIGHRCPEFGHYHLVDDSVIVEVLSDGRPVEVGERGEVVITVLHAFTMPFIRYRLGDLAIRGPEQCPCGRPFSTLAKIEGRSLDFFRLPNGELRHPYEFTDGLYREKDNWVRRFQLTQLDLRRVRWTLETRRPPTAAELHELVDPFEALAERHGPIEVSIDLVDSIPREPSGKLREFQSLVSRADPPADPAG